MEGQSYRILRPTMYLSATYVCVCRGFSLEERKDFIPLAGILRLATKYGANNLRINSLRAFEQKYPSSLAAWERLASRRTYDPVLIINLAREVSTLSILPAAMTSLANSTSAGELFDLPLHETTPQRIPLHSLNAQDVRGFVLMKEYNHVSIVRMLHFIRGLGRDCIQPPELETRSTIMAPVGTPRREPRVSVCAKIFPRVADMLALKLVSEDPVGYHDFGMEVQETMQQKWPICRRCRANFEMGYADHRADWWAGIPRVLGIAEWDHDRITSPLL